MFTTMRNNEEEISLFLAYYTNKDYEYIYNNLLFLKNKLDKTKNVEAKRTVDMLVNLDGKVYNIEMNNNASKTMLERNLDYNNRIYHSKRVTGSKYEYQYTIQFNINNFTFKGNDSTIEEYYIQNQKYILTDKIKFVFIYLPNIRKKYYNKEKLSNLERLLMVFNESNKKEAMKIAGGSEVMKEYRKEAEEASAYDDMIESLTYDREEMLRCTMEIDKRREIEKVVEKAVKNKRRNCPRSARKDN